MGVFRQSFPARAPFCPHRDSISASPPADEDALLPMLFYPTQNDCPEIRRIKYTAQYREAVPII